MMTNLTTELNEAEAMALAQFLKRIGFSEFRALAINNDDAYLMQNAASKVARSLADIGYNPR